MDDTFHHRRVSRQAKELSLLSLLVILMKMTMTVAVESLMSIYDSFVEIWSSKVNLGRQNRILGVALVESIDKRSIFCLDNSINR